MKHSDFTVINNKFHIESFLKSLNARIFVKINNNKYEQIYIDKITKNGIVIIYDNKFNRTILSKFITKKRNVKKASTSLRFIYYSFQNNDKKYKLYNYLKNLHYI